MWFWYATFVVSVDNIILQEVIWQRNYLLFFIFYLHLAAIWFSFHNAGIILFLLNSASSSKGLCMHFTLDTL